MSSSSFVEVEKESIPASPGRYLCESLWTIVDFRSTVTSVGQTYFGPSFAPTDESNYRWFVGLLYTKEAEEEFLDLFVKPDFLRTLEGSNLCSLRYKLTVEDVNRRTIAHWGLESMISSDIYSTTHRLKYTDVAEKLIDDELLIRVDLAFELMEGNANRAFFSRSHSLSNTSNRLLSDMSAMLGNETFSDVELIVDDSGTQHAIPAHQILLSARSPFFHAKLTHDTQESREKDTQESREKDTQKSRKKRIMITDLDITTVRNILAYIYTDRFDRSLEANQVIKLLKGAQKYSITGLKHLCELHLIENINDSNVFDCLVAADLYKANDLKARALEIICTNKRNIRRIKEALHSTLLETSQEQKLSLLTEVMFEVTSRFHPN